MAHRTQITLEDEQYQRLQSEARATGLGMAELVRRAVDQVYGSTSRQFAHGLDLSFGAWGDDDIDGAAFVEERRTARSDRFSGT